ncbi:hypothetical protein JCM10213_007984 [Rhodosporidiobolus nylandii]
MAEAVTYNNGLYTPWTPAGAAPATTAAAAGTTEAAWWITTSSSAAAMSSATSMTPVAESPSSSSTTTTTTSSSSSSSSSSSPTSSLASSSHASSSHASAATLSRIVESPSASASSASSSDSSFKITYLIPVFVAIPIICVFALLGATYGKRWARRKPESPLTDRGSGWWAAGAAGGASWSSRRSRRTAADEEEEAGGLVEEAALPSGSPAADAADAEKAGDAPVMVKSASRWSNLFTPGSRHKEVPFLSVSYASLDKPFAPPSRSSSIASGLNRSASNSGDRGWGWGMALPRSHGTSSALATQHEQDEAAQDNQHLAPGVWGMGTASQRYRPRKASTKSKASVTSKLSDKLFGRGGNSGGGGLAVPGGELAAEDMPSPSVYSPTFEPQPQMNPLYDGPAYGGTEEDLEDDDDEKVDYDAVLGAARVGDGELAKRYIKGEVLPEELRSQSQQQNRAVNPFSEPAPTFQVDLPTAPSRLQVSPKKAKSDLLRPPPPGEARATPPPQLLFDYSSPQSSPEKVAAARRALPTVPPSRSSPTRGLTDPPARVPFRQQQAPQLSRPPRSTSVPYPQAHADMIPPPRTTATPLSPETRPDLFFASPPISPPTSSAGHGFASIGSPMPPFEPGALRASETAFSLAGLGGLIYSNDAEQPQEGGGLRDYVERERRRSKNRAQEIEQLKKSAPDVKPGMIVKSAVALQAAKAPGPAPPSQPQGRLKKASSKPDLRPRESLGFDPVFAESPELPPLQHPSKVKAAIETLEKRSSREIPSSLPSASASSSRTPSPTKGEKRTSRSRMPSPPAPQKLERSTTTIAPARPPAGQRYSRPLGGRHRGDAGSDLGGDSDDSEAIAKQRRVSMLILQRSRSKSADGVAGGLAGMLSDGPGSESSHSHSHESGPVSVPLSSDKERMSRLLRRTSTPQGVQGLAIDSGSEEGGLKVETDGKVGGGAMDALTRRSMAS